MDIGFSGSRNYPHKSNNTRIDSERQASVILLQGLKDNIESQKYKFNITYIMTKL